MARCGVCGRDMRLLVSCVNHKYKLDGKKRFAIPYGSTGEGRNENIELPENCWDCGTPKGGYHHPGCLEERCPADGTPYMVCRHPKDDAIKNRERSWGRAAMNMPYRGMVTNPGHSSRSRGVDLIEWEKDPEMGYSYRAYLDGRLIEEEEFLRRDWAVRSLGSDVVNQMEKSGRRSGTIRGPLGILGMPRTMRTRHMRPLLSLDNPQATDSSADRASEAYRGMVANPDGTPQADVDEASEAYRAFHQADPSKMRKISIPEMPKAAWKLGRLIEVVYKPEGQSHRRDSAYQHKFGDFGNPIQSMRFGKLKPILAVSEDGNQLLIIRDVSKFHVNERGIVG